VASGAAVASRRPGLASAGPRIADDFDIRSWHRRAPPGVTPRLPDPPRTRLVGASSAVQEAASVTPGSGARSPRGPLPCPAACGRRAPCASPGSCSTRARSSCAGSARAGNRRFGLLSARRAHTKLPYKIDLIYYRKRQGRLNTRAGPDSGHAGDARGEVGKLAGVRLRFGRIVGSEIESPNMLVHLV
jgi:hypothetical protein